MSLTNVRSPSRSEDLVVLQSAHYAATPRSGIDMLHSSSIPNGSLARHTRFGKKVCLLRGTGAGDLYGSTSYIACIMLTLYRILGSCILHADDERMLVNTHPLYYFSLGHNFYACHAGI